MSPREAKPKCSSCGKKHALIPVEQSGSFSIWECSRCENRETRNRNGTRKVSNKVRKHLNLA